LCVLAAILLSLVRYMPSTSVQLPSPGQPGLIDGQIFTISRVEALQLQHQDPWVFLDGRNQETSRWRLLIPAVAHWLRVPTPIYLLCPRIGGALLVFVSAWLAWRGTRKVIPTLGIAALTATSAPFLVAMDWILFDPYLLLALLVFSYARSSTVVWAAAALGPWIDERFILILPAMAGLRWAREQKAFYPALWGVLPYGLVRLTALALGDSSFGDQLKLQQIYNSYWPEGCWYGFRAAWIPIIVGLGATGWAIRSRMGASALGLWIASLLTGLGAIMWLAYDTSRSIAVLLPFLIYGGIVLSRLPGATLIILGSVILNFSLPCAHVIGASYYPIAPLWQPPVNRGFYFDPAHPLP
jgi:hypothetical protein